MLTVLAKRPLLCLPMASKSAQEHSFATTIEAGATTSCH